MPQKKIVDLVFPAGGLVKRYAYQSQPPFSSPDCKNVRSVETLEGRDRGGSRPGLGKASYDVLGSGNPIRLLDTVSALSQDSLTFWDDNFQGTSLGSVWSVANWSSLVIPTIFPHDYANITYGTAAGAVRSALTYDTASPYQIDLFCVPYQDRYWGKFQIFARMDNTTPVATTAGVVAELVMNDALGTYSGTLKVYVASTPTTYTFSTAATGNAEAGWFSMLVTTNNVKIYWLGTEILNQNISAAAGARFGFGLEATVAGGIQLVDSFRVQHQTTDKSQNIKRYLVASANGTVYRDNFLNKLVSIGGSLSLNSDRALRSAEHLQKLYIADNGNPRALGTDGVFASNGIDLTAASISDWTAQGISINDDVVVISNATGNIVNNTYQISAVVAGKLTTTTSVGGSGTCTWRVERCPKIYDPIANTLTRWMATTTFGAVPVGCPLIAMYQGRMVLAAHPLAPHAWFMSRVDDPLDWDYAPDPADGAQAVSGATSDTGLIGDPLTAISTHGDDKFIFGCDTSLWVLRGNPASGGQVDNLSRIVGILDKKAFCRGPGGEFVFLGRDGLYMIDAGAQAYPQSISRERLPKELLDIDKTMYAPVLAYDIRDRGIHIYLTCREARSQIHYWFDWKTKTFWPVSMQATHEPTTIYEYVSNYAVDSAVLIGGRDGYIRRYRNEHNRDDGSTISSYVFYGPIRLGGSDYHSGYIDELIGALDVNGGAVNWSVFVGDTHEAAFGSTAFATGTWALQGLNYKNRPRASGASFYLKLANNTTKPWAIERVTALIRRAGDQVLT